MLRTLSAFVLLISCAAAALAAEQSETNNAAIKFAGITSKPTKLQLGKTLKFEAELKPIDVAKTWAVSVGGHLENPTDKKMFFSYQIAFFDKDKNLIGCQNYTHFIEPGKKAQAGTFISLSADQIDKIASYSVVFYESDAPIGAK